MAVLIQPITGNAPRRSVLPVELAGAAFSRVYHRRPTPRVLKRGRGVMRLCFGLGDAKPSERSNRARSSYLTDPHPPSAGESAPCEIARAGQTEFETTSTGPSAAS
jgi:hypothetical protein